MIASIPLIKNIWAIIEALRDTKYTGLEIHGFDYSEYATGIDSTFTINHEYEEEETTYRYKHWTGENFLSSDPADIYNETTGELAILSIVGFFDDKEENDELGMETVWSFHTGQVTGPVDILHNMNVAIAASSV